jgi:hypothetical protein
MVSPVVAHAAQGQQCHASGGSPSCLLSESVLMPLTLGVSVTTQPAVNATVSWTSSCSRDGVPVIRSGTGAGMAPFQAKVAVPVTNGADCTITATVRASGQASLTAVVVYTVGQPFTDIIPQGTNYSGQPIYDDVCLADPGNNPALGAKVEIMACQTLFSQAWTYRGGELIHGRYCLTDPRSGGIRTKLILWTCTGAADQLWTYQGTHATDGEWSLRAHSGSMCLDDPKTSVSNGTQLIVYTCNNGQSQKWFIG